MRVVLARSSRAMPRLRPAANSLERCDQMRENGREDVIETRPARGNEGRSLASRTKTLKLRNCASIFTDTETYGAVVHACRNRTVIVPCSLTFLGGGCDAAKKQQKRKKPPHGGDDGNSLLSGHSVPTSPHTEKGERIC